MTTRFPTKPRCNKLITRAFQLTIKEKTLIFYGKNAWERKKQLIKDASLARKALRDHVLQLERRSGQY